MIYLFLIGRVLFGGFFMMSGYGHLKNLKGTAAYAGSKGVPIPKLAVFCTGLMLIFGGAGVLFGIREVIALYLLILFLVIVTPTMHAYWKDTDPMQKMGNRVNFYKNIALLGAALMLLALHSGAIPVSNWALF